MVLPGWNVTEPITVAVKFCQLVQSYRDAPDEIQDFASHVNSFHSALELFDSCLKQPELIEAEHLQRLRTVLGTSLQCAENCKAFLDRFLDQYYSPECTDGIRAADRLLWVWKKERAVELEANIQSQVNFINLQLNLAEL
jgi:hypothetical protein